MRTKNIKKEEVQIWPKTENQPTSGSSNGENMAKKSRGAEWNVKNKFRYQKLLNCLAHAKCLLMSCMFTDNLI